MSFEIYDNEWKEGIKEIRGYVRRIGNDVYDTNTKDGYNLVQEDWIAGSLEAILEYSKAIDLEMTKKYKDAGYINEKTRKIRNEIRMISYRVNLLVNPLHTLEQ